MLPNENKLEYTSQNNKLISPNKQSKSIQK